MSSCFLEKKKQHYEIDEKKAYMLQSIKCMKYEKIDLW